MKSLQELNKINRLAVELTEKATTFSENMEIFRKYERDVEAYRNALLKSLAGKEVTVTGYLTAQHKSGNYALTCVEVNINGCVVDTIHHLNVYKDIVTRGSSVINGVWEQHYGDYDHHEVIAESKRGIENNVPPSQVMRVTCRGIVYQYKHKWSVGSQRQVEWAAANQ